MGKAGDAQGLRRFSGDRTSLIGDNGCCERTSVPWYYAADPVGDHAA